MIDGEAVVLGVDGATGDTVADMHPRTIAALEKSAKNAIGGSSGAARPKPSARIRQPLLWCRPLQQGFHLDIARFWEAQPPGRATSDEDFCERPALDVVAGGAMIQASS